MYRKRKYIDVRNADIDNEITKSPQPSIPKPAAIDAQAPNTPEKQAERLDIQPLSMKRLCEFFSYIPYRNYVLKLLIPPRKTGVRELRSRYFQNMPSCGRKR